MADLPALPSSALSARWHVGRDYFERVGARAEVDPAPQGLVASLEDMARPGMPTERVDPAIRFFFERTADLELLVFPEWRAGFRVGAWLFRWVAARVGQLCLPFRHGEGAAIDTTVCAVDSAKDGRAGVRGVVRTYARDRRPMHVAAYATHRIGDAGYMSVAFPLPGGNLFGVLRLDPLGMDDDGPLGAALTSALPPSGRDLVGTWYASRLGRAPLPLRETLRFWTPRMRLPFAFDARAFPGTTVVGRHEMRLFGVRFVSHTYYLRPR